MDITFSLLNKTRSALRTIYGERLDKIILYGSYARGEQTPESDIDLLIVLNDPQLDTGKEIRLINNFIYPLSIQYNIDISAHPVTQKKFLKGAGFFLKLVKKEGKEL